MGKQARLHRNKVRLGLEEPFRQAEIAGEQRFICNKCHTIMPESRVTDHLKECQPGGVKCVKCGDVYPQTEFLAHIKSCNGRQGVDGAFNLKLDTEVKP